jgi:hypothetical protein
MSHSKGTSGKVSRPVYGARRMGGDSEEEIESDIPVGTEEDSIAEDIEESRGRQSEQN